MITHSMLKRYDILQHVVVRCRRNTPHQTNPMFCGEGPSDGVISTILFIILLVNLPRFYNFATLATLNDLEIWLDIE